MQLLNSHFQCPFHYLMLLCTTQKMTFNDIILNDPLRRKLTVATELPKAEIQDQLTQQSIIAI